MDGIIKVDTQTLINTAENFNTKGNQIHTLTGEMLSLIKGLQSAWEGEAFAAYTGQFAQLEDDMDEMYRRIAEHVTDLKNMAQKYEEAEKLNVETGRALDGDVIV